MVSLPLSVISFCLLKLVVGLSEVGDLSGKFGKSIAATGSTTYREDLLVDYYPPIIANYKTDIKNSIMWSSIVFHCGDSTSTRLFCADLSTVDTDACAAAFSSFDTSPTAMPTLMPSIAPTSGEDNTDDGDPAVERTTVTITLSVIVGVVIGVIMSQVLTYFIVLRQAKESMLRLAQSDDDL
jgi:hypothetical protein